MQPPKHLKSFQFSKMDHLIRRSFKISEDITIWNPFRVLDTSKTYIKLRNIHKAFQRSFWNPFGIKTSGNSFSGFSTTRNCSRVWDSEFIISFSEFLSLIFIAKLLISILHCGMDVNTSLFYEYIPIHILLYLYPCSYTLDLLCHIVFFIHSISTSTVF